MREQQPHALAQLAGLVSVNSFTANVGGVNRVQGRLAAQLSALGLHVTVTNCKDRGPIIEATTERY